MTIVARVASLFAAAYSSRVVPLSEKLLVDKNNNPLPLFSSGEHLSDGANLFSTPFGTSYADDCPALKNHSNGVVDDELRIVTWNVEWAYSPHSKRVQWVKEIVEPSNASAIRCPQDMFDKKKIEKPFRRGHHCYNRKSMEQHLDYLGQVLKWMDPPPHIVNMNELDGCSAAADIGAYLPDHQPYLTYGDDDRTTQQVGFLSSIAPVSPLRRFLGQQATPVPGNSHCAVDMNVQGLSKHYIAKFDIPGKLRFFMIGVHLKSMRQELEGQACSIREAEAKLLDDVLRALHAEDPDAEVLVLGDFNDFDPDVLDRRGAYYSEWNGKEFPVGWYRGCVKDESGNYSQGYVYDEGATGQKSRVFEIIKGDGVGRPKLENLMGRVERKRRYSHKGAMFAPFVSACGSARWDGDKKCGAPRPWVRFDYRTMDARDCSGDALLDYMLASPRLAAAVKDIRILNEHDFNTVYSTERFVKWGGRRAFFDGIGVEKERRARDADPSMHEKGFTPSDHFPVSLTLDMNAFKAQS